MPFVLAIPFNDSRNLAYGVPYLALTWLIHVLPGPYLTVEHCTLPVLAPPGPPRPAPSGTGDVAMTITHCPGNITVVLGRSDLRLY